MNRHRRAILRAGALGAFGTLVPGLEVAFAEPSVAAGFDTGPATVGSGAGESTTPKVVPSYQRLLVLIELKGGNDGFNTLVPYADPGYRALRPKLGVARDDLVVLSDRVGLHRALAPVAALWERRELAVLQGVGYPEPNLSHFRSIEIWNTASRSNQYLDQGWLTRSFAEAPTPASFAADGVVVGSNDMGPLAGGGTRAIALADTDAFVRRARLARSENGRGNAALAHILKVEDDIVRAATRLDGHHAFATAFPASAFGRSIAAACQVIAAQDSVAAVRLTLDGFDTHRGQQPTQARLLQELAEGIVAFKAALVELGRYDDTLAITYAEFGRRPQENASAGTDHGTASVHFAFGGRVAGGLYGETPSLARLAPNANVAYALDFRSVYATALDRWWGVDSRDVLGARFEPLPFLRA